MSKVGTVVEVENLNEITDVMPAALTASGNYKVSIEEGSSAGTEYTEDAAAPANPVGGVLMMTRDDALSTVTEAEGDWSRLRGTAEGALWTQDFNSDAILADTAALVVDLAAIEVLLGTIDTDTGVIAGDTTSIDGKITACNTGAVVVSSGTITANLGATDNAVLDQIELNTDPLLVVGGGAEATAQRVTIANDSTGLVSVDDGGGALTVDGTVTANLSATDNAVLDTIDAVLDAIKIDTEAIETAVEGTLTVDLGANNDVIATGSVAHDGADSGNPIKTGGRAQEPTAQPDEVADNDRVDTLHDRVGRVATYQGYPRWYAAINTATSGNNTIKAAAGAGKKIVVTSVTIISDGTVDIRWESGAGGTALSGQMPLQAREGYSASDPNGLFQTAANALLNLELSAAINVHGHISGIIIDD